MTKTLEIKNGLQILVGLPDAVVQERKDLAKATLLAECRKLLPEQEQQQPGTSAIKATQRPGFNKEDEFFAFAENEEDTYSTAEAEVAEYLKSGANGIDTLITDTGRGVADGVLGESEHCFAEQGKTLRSIPLYRGGLPLELLLTLGGGGPVWVLHDVSGYFTVFPIWLMRVRNVVLSASG
ncbi:unnamed protein product [Boreogadus saida]